MRARRSAVLSRSIAMSGLAFLGSDQHGHQHNSPVFCFEQCDEKAVQSHEGPG
jgi:hypothetical protein